MSYHELETATLQCLVDSMTPGIRNLIHDLLAKGFELTAVRECLVRITRDMAQGQTTFTELGIREYLDRVESGDIVIPKKADPESGINLSQVPTFDVD